MAAGVFLLMTEYIRNSFKSCMIKTFKLTQFSKKLIDIIVYREVQQNASSRGCKCGDCYCSSKEQTLHTANSLDYTLTYSETQN